MIKSNYDYRDSGIEWLGDIPRHWGVTLLKRICDLSYGDSLPEDKRNDGDIPVYGSNGIVGLHDISNALAPVIIVGRKGSYGKLNYSTEKVFAIDTTYYIDESTTTRNIRWLYYALSCLQLDEGSKDSAVPGLSREDAYKHCVPVCNSYEQQAIASFLDRETARIDALISKKERMIELLKEKRIALITQAVTKGLDPSAKMKDSGIEWLGEVPEHWEIVKLKFIGNALIGLTYSPDSIVFENGILVLRASNIQDSSLSLDREDDVYVETQIPSKLMVIENDILICSRNGSRALIGKSAVVKGIVHATFGAFMTVYRSRFNTFIRWVLQSSMFSSLCSGYVTSTINQLTQDSLNNITVPLPPENEIERISEFLESEIQRSETLIVKTENSITLLREYRSSLIHSAVTGKIDLRDYHELDV